MNVQKITLSLVGSIDIIETSRSNRSSPHKDTDMPRVMLRPLIHVWRTNEHIDPDALGGSVVGWCYGSRTRSNLANLEMSYHVVTLIALWDYRYVPTLSGWKREKERESEWDSGQWRRDVAELDPRAGVGLGV